jgi:protein-tyrosine-phosphatase
MSGSPTKIRRVLFVCAGNTCRSPMAEALARLLLGGDAHVESAGISADDGATATRGAIRAMKERGVDISGHRSRSLSALNLLDFDLVVGLTSTIAQAIREQVVDAPEVKALDIPDPYGKGLDAYRATALALERDVRGLFDLNRERTK